jgi:LacI family transcriptional regulator
MKKTLTEKVKEKILSEYIQNSSYSLDYIPPERKIAKLFDVSLITARRAIESLVQSNYLIKKQGSGTYIASKYTETPKFSVGLVIPEDQTTPFYSLMAEKVESLLRQENYQVHFFVAREAEEFINTIRSNKTSIDGLILCGYIIHHKLLRKEGIPYVIAGNEESCDADSVIFDLKSGAEKAVNYLISEGHHKVLFLSHYEENFATAKKLDKYFQFERSARFSGFSEAMENAGLHVTSDLIVHTGPSRRNSYLKVKELIKKHKNDFTAIFASTDLLAEGAIHAIRESGHEVPKDFSVIGCDNLQRQEDLLIPLSTLDLRLDEVAIQSLDLLKSRMENPRLEEYRSHSLIPRLIIRSTTAKARVKNI